MSRPCSRIEPELGSRSRTTQFASARLAAARLADEAEHLALVERERDSVDRMHRAAAAPADEAATGGEVHDEVVDLEHRSGTHATRSDSGWEQATKVVRTHGTEHTEPA